MTTPKSKKLLDLYREQIRTKQYSPHTEETYTHWVREYILFHKKRHPREMGVQEINQFITHLVVECKASASTQDQALSAIIFLYGGLLKIDLDESALNFVRPKTGKRISVVLSREEVCAIIANMTAPWDTYPKHRTQFKAEVCKQTLPATILGSKAIWVHVWSGYWSAAGQ